MSETTTMIHPELPGQPIQVPQWGVGRHEARGWEVAEDAPAETARHEAPEVSTATVPSGVGPADETPDADVVSPSIADEDAASESTPKGTSS